MNCKFRVFRATDDFESCRKFKEGHENLLREYNVISNSRNDDTWMLNPNVFCIVAESSIENKIIGGVRITISNREHSLPIERAILKMNKKITAVVEKLREKGGVAEVGALWHSKRVAGSGLSILLLRAAIAFVPQLQVQTVLSLCADFSWDIFNQTGFKDLADMEGENTYPFPSEFYKAKIVGMHDLKGLADVESASKTRIESLRENPHQVYMEEVDGEGTKVTYDLQLSK